MNMRTFLGSAAISLLPGLAMAGDEITKATPQAYSSGGLAGANVGCLYLTTDEGLFTLPFNLNPNTAQLVAVGTLTHPTFGTVSFAAGGANPALCPRAVETDPSTGVVKDWPNARIIMGQVSSP